jgi:CTP:molybdopterin cytidylyltransferase MocA
LVKPVLAVILAGGEGERLSILSSVRAKPAVPFGGKYRIIDFTLSNCVNSGVDSVAILTQYNPRSLNDHVGLGRPWDLDRSQGGVRMLQPYVKRGKVAEWYSGTADAVLQNISVIERGGDIVLILAGDHIYKMDYQPFIAAHRREAGGSAHRAGIWQERQRPDRARRDQPARNRGRHGLPSRCKSDGHARRACVNVRDSSRDGALARRVVVRQDRGATWTCER